MDLHVVSSATRTPQVIELVIEETIVYECTWTIEIHTSTRAIRPKKSPGVQLKQQTTLTHARPIARVYPAIRQRERSVSTENDDKGETIEEKIVNPLEFIEVRPDPISVYTCTEEKGCDLTSDIQKTQKENKDDICSHSHARLSRPNLNNNNDLKDKNVTTVISQESHPTWTSIPNNTTSQERPDPCACHRDWVREKVLQEKNEIKYLKTMECSNGEGCHVIEEEDKQNETHKETSITDCLEEFLTGLHLTHLLDYLKVLGCMCVRDLRLLEMPELEAIQLISRRRLLQQLDSLTLHHEAPPKGCSLEAWLTWYGLTHTSGFLTAIGVHSVGDLDYLREDDLMLLKPVTRRRILACHVKIGKKNGRKMDSGLIRNDYLM